VKTEQKRKLEDLLNDLLEEKALNTIISDHFNITYENGRPSDIEIKRYFSEYAILNSMLTKKLTNTINLLEEIIKEN
jgi:hypothetical protein